MFQSSIEQNIRRQAPFLFFDKEAWKALCYPVEMAGKRKHSILREWIKRCGWTQTRLAAELGWQESKLSRHITGETPPDIVDLHNIAKVIGVRTYELMMPVAEAMAVRNLRASAEAIVAETRSTYQAEPAIVHEGGQDGSAKSGSTKTQPVEDRLPDNSRDIGCIDGAGFLYPNSEEQRPNSRDIH